MIENLNSPSNNAILLRAGRNESPLFLTHCGRGQLLYAAELTKYIEPTIPVYGLPDALGSYSTLRTLEGMATRMVRMIRKVQPIGPYRIAGWSFGGALAYEIASQLLGADQNVDFLGLIGTLFPGGPHLTPSDEIYEQSCDRESIAHDTERRPYAYTRALLGYAVHSIPTFIHYFVAEDYVSKGNIGLRTSNNVPSTNQLAIITIPRACELMMSSSSLEIIGQAISSAMRGSISFPRALPRENSYSPLVPLHINPKEERILFCVPGAGASVTSFVDLVARVSATWLVYGLQPRGMDGDCIPHTTVESCAEFYFHKLKNLHVGRPVHLLGHSLGGWVAFDLAQRLTDSGREVASLTIIDTVPPDLRSFHIRESTNEEAILEWIRVTEVQHGRSLNISAEDLTSRSHKEQRVLLHGRLVSINALPSRTHPDLLSGPLATFKAGLRTNYIPQTIYLGHTILVLVKNTLLGYAYSQETLDGIIDRWKRWAPNLTHLIAHGNHMTVLRKPQVLTIADLFMTNHK